MRFDNIKTLTAIICCVLLTACATQQVSLPQAGQKVELLPTSQFVPTLSYDDKAMLLIREPIENPYTASSARVDKGSVLLFIEAKKALRKDDLKTAKQKLTVITRNDTSLSGPWVLLGEIAIKKQNYKLAQQHFKKALSINGDNINAYGALARSQRLMGEFHVAQNTLALALEKWADFPEGHLNIGILYDMYLNKPLLAQQHFEAYLFLNDYKNKKAMDWYTEIKQRTGHNQSFIDASNGIHQKLLDHSQIAGE